jgi:hypothetical protein
MAYIYHVSFDVRPEQASELQIGHSLERVLGYLRSLLPSQDGYISSRAMYSVDEPETTDLVVQSMWHEWSDLDKHRQSALAEDKVLTEFEPHVSLKDLVVRIYEEVD